MSESIQVRQFMRHWPMAATVCLLLLAGFLQSEIVRASVAAVCIGLMIHQWLTYRRTSNGARFVFQSLIVAGFSLASVWLALNVVRFYTYNPESERIWAWHGLVAQIQDALVWVIGALAITVSLWSLLQFAQRLGRRFSTGLGRLA